MTEVMDMDIDLEATNLLQGRDESMDFANLPETTSPDLGTTDIETEVTMYQDAEIVGDELI